jgi:hypothetical protein
MMMEPLAQFACALAGRQFPGYRRPRSAANDTKRAENEQLFGVDDVGREYSNRQAATSSHSRRLNASVSSFVLTAVAN